MSLAQALSIVAVLISAGTLVVALKRFDHERELEDRKDARTTLAAGALKLGRAKAVQKDVFTVFEPLLSGKGKWPENFHEYLRNLEQTSETLESALAAIRIRFPRNAEVVTELSSAWEAGRSLMRLYVTAHRSQQRKVGSSYRASILSAVASRQRELADQRSDEAWTPKSITKEEFDAIAVDLRSSTGPIA